jgi:hypothetical protein
MFKGLLKDYPFRTWVEAADGCALCSARYQVRVTYVDESGCYGDVEYRIRHAEGCPEKVENQAGSAFDVAGWTYADKPVKLEGKQIYPLKARGNIGPCLNCGKLVIGIPVILFMDEGKGGELDFCISCFETLGLVKRLEGEP